MEIVSTYRIQFHRKFTFRDAAAIVPYLHQLGITHVYASPYLVAVAGSMHGYDVIDHSQLNPEIGTTQDYCYFVGVLAQHGMSHILDTVPNHMGVETNENHWWNDVLAQGPNSQFANYFDIDWQGIGTRKELTGKVLMPVLADTLAETFEKKMLLLKTENGKTFIQYHDRQFPVDPYTDISQSLPDILSRQHYRLCHWRVSSDEINYRRFFDITGLAALQMQKQEVFDASHQFTFSLIAEGSVAGLRVDHPDGLLDPEAYFDRLRSRGNELFANKGPLPVWVEKILNGDEQLCQDWKVTGTSGYDFLSATNDLFVDCENEKAMSDAYESFAGTGVDYAQAVYQAKLTVLDSAMYGEIQALTNRLDGLAQSELLSQDFTRRSLYQALREVIACFGVYRSYVSDRGVSEFDIAMVDAAVAQARIKNPKIELASLTFVRDSVLLQYPVADSNRARQLDFAQRFQQLTSPVNAKGIEDCVFYNFNRLISLNEVGGDPSRFGRDCEEIHDYLSDRQKHWPLALSCLSTHDTKRSEDVRARLNVLSEVPEEWASRLYRWKKLNAPLCGDVHLNDQCLLYQTLLGAWPLEILDENGREIFVKRIQAYMIKAMREAKQRTSWRTPGKEYERAVSCLITRLIDPKAGAVFLADFLPFQKWICQRGMINSVAQTVLRLTAPGICDTYQGTELWDLSLVDPDNRRPVDYGHRQKMLATIEHGLEPAKLLDNMEDGRIKLWITTTLLRYRRQSPSLFLKGSYEQIRASGHRAKNIFCFARVLGNQHLVVIVPRLVATLQQNDRWGNEDWGDTHIVLPASFTSTEPENVLTRKKIVIAEHRTIAVASVLGDFPVAVLRTVF